MFDIIFCLFSLTNNQQRTKELYHVILMSSVIIACSLRTGVPSSLAPVAIHPDQNGTPIEYTQEPVNGTTCDVHLLTFDHNLEFDIIFAYIIFGVLLRCTHYELVSWGFIFQQAYENATPETAK